MYQKDYVLRMIAMLMKFIGEVLGLIKKGDLKKASEELKMGYNTFLKEDAAFFRNIPEKELTGNFSVNTIIQTDILKFLQSSLMLKLTLSWHRETTKGALNFRGRLFCFMNLLIRNKKLIRRKGWIRLIF